MQQQNSTTLSEPRMEKLGALNVVGFSRHYSFDKVAEIPDQWQSFAGAIPQLTKDPTSATYGVIYNGGAESFDYLTGLECAREAGAPANMVSLALAPQSYPVFWHPGHVATLRETCAAIWSDWLPASDKVPVEAPWFERYGAEFDPQTGAGGVEIWIPVQG